VDKKFIGRAIFLRHGQTDYTDVFPDLNKDGVETIQKSAEEIKLAIGSSVRIRMVSSPLPRAMGTASIIAKAIGYLDPIREAPALRAAVVRDKPRAMAVFNEHMAQGGPTELAWSYEEDPRYKDASMIEPVSEIQKRFYKYLSGLVWEMLCFDVAWTYIHVSHYEVLYDFVHSIFRINRNNGQPLSYGEIVDIRFFEIGGTEKIKLNITFRGKTAQGMILNCETAMLQL